MKRSPGSSGAGSRTLTYTPFALPSSRSTSRSSTKATVAACGATCGSSPNSTCAADPPRLFSRWPRVNSVPFPSAVSRTSFAANGGGCSSGMGSATDSAGTGTCSAFPDARTGRRSWRSEPGHGERLRRGLVGRDAVAGSESQSCLGGLFVGDGEGAQLLGERLGNMGGRREAGGRCRVRRLPGFGEERQAAVRAHGHAGLVVGLAAAADIAQRLRRGKLGLQLLLPQRRPASLALVGGVFVLLAARRTGNHGCASIRAARRMGQSADNKGRIDHWHTASNRVSGGLPELS